MKKRILFYITILTIMILCCITQIAKAEYFDGKREGLIFGGGIGYGAVAVGDYGSASGLVLLGKLGYGVTDQLSFFISSDVKNIVLRFGADYFIDQSTPFFLQGTVGYNSPDDDSIISVSGGVGYEFSKHLTLELMMGYYRLNETYISTYNIFTGATTKQTNIINFATIAITFNVYSY